MVASSPIQLRPYQQEEDCMPPSLWKLVGRPRRPP